MKAKLIKRKSTSEIKSTIEECMADSFQPTLTIVYISKSQYRKAVSNLWTDAIQPFFGNTTNGELIISLPIKND